ncbi:hypothetical protein WJX84_000607 [Apatococcus fuscideae]|uniref:Uncharacterized protein n=1 Tax=Apatococcus fuscideae TaxID=2026836 RepID=A0AAW1SWZ9_9CHLO
MPLAPAEGVDELRGPPGKAWSRFTRALKLKKGRGAPPDRPHASLLSTSPLQKVTERWTRGWPSRNRNSAGAPDRDASVADGTAGLSVWASSHGRLRASQQDLPADPLQVTRTAEGKPHGRVANWAKTLQRHLAPSQSSKPPASKPMEPEMKPTARARTAPPCTDASWAYRPCMPGVSSASMTMRGCQEATRAPQGSPPAHVLQSCSPALGSIPRASASEKPQGMLSPQNADAKGCSTAKEHVSAMPHTHRKGLPGWRAKVAAVKARWTLLPAMADAGEWGTYKAL